METISKKERFTPENFGVMDAFVIDETLHDLIASLTGLYSVIARNLAAEQPEKAKELETRGRNIFWGEREEFNKSYEERKEAIDRYSKEYKELDKLYWLSRGKK